MSCSSTPAGPGALPGVLRHTSHTQWQSGGPALSILFFQGEQARHLLCPYDVDGLDDQVMQGAQHSHPFVEEGERGEETAAHSPESPIHSPQSPSQFAGTLTPPRSQAQVIGFGAEDLVSLRHRLADWSAGEGLGKEAAQELILAVNELATNSIRYGGGQGRLLLWREHDNLMCEVQDAGHIEDPLVGQSRPAPDQDSGRGLWLVHQLCDLVEIRSSPAAGTSIRVHKRRAREEV
jgi:anti-sigma regulatory factor (Ser/Thr protein kinase)